MKIYILALVAVLAVVSCKKKEVVTTTTSSATTTSVTTPIVSAGFKWTENGGAEITADSSRFSAQYKTLFAFKGSKMFEINLSGSSVATYNIGTANALTLVSGGANNAATAGDVKISANASSKISGTFDVTMNTGGLTNVKGLFIDVAVK
ncbi:MAG: hypothetical protein H7331_11520 [Bacteroidia bacterium]|nr:hypothetical protein [Bacteroidia bacterium]